MTHDGDVFSFPLFQEYWGGILFHPSLFIHPKEGVDSGHADGGFHEIIRKGIIRQLQGALLGQTAHLFYPSRVWMSFVSEGGRQPAALTYNSCPVGPGENLFDRIVLFLEVADQVGEKRPFVPLFVSISS